MTWLTTSIKNNSFTIPHENHSTPFNLENNIKINSKTTYRLYLSNREYNSHTFFLTLCTIIFTVRFRVCISPCREEFVTPILIESTQIMTSGGFTLNSKPPSYRYKSGFSEPEN